VILDVDGAPIVKATPEYRYVLGPLERFGNLFLPAWGVYDNGYTRYEMESANGDHEPLDPALFLVPPASHECAAATGTKRFLAPGKDGSFPEDGATDGHLHG
jgi:hypothetical protein